MGQKNKNELGLRSFESQVEPLEGHKDQILKRHFLLKLTSNQLNFLAMTVSLLNLNLVRRSKNLEQTTVDNIQNRV